MEESSSFGSQAGTREWVQQAAGHCLSGPWEHWWAWPACSDSKAVVLGIHPVGVKHGALPQTVSVEVQNSFVEVLGLQKQAKWAVQGDRQSVSIQGRGRGVGQMWVPL